MFLIQKITSERRMLVTQECLVSPDHSHADSQHFPT